MERARYGVVLFYTIDALFRLERELARRGIAAEAVPVPRELSSDCGSALRFAPADEPAVRGAIEELELEVQGIHAI